MQRRQKQQCGFTLMEVVVTLGIAVLGLLTITQLTQLYLKLLAQEKAHSTAAALANKQIEIIRNLPYNDVGTIGGIPPGNLTQIETITTNTIDFTVKTDVVYIDDPFDGQITTAGSNNSIYQATNPEVMYYWGMESTTSGQAPDIGFGSLTITGAMQTSGQTGNAIELDNGDSITTTSNGNLSLAEGRIGLWYQPATDDAVDQGEYFLALELSTGLDFEFYRRTNERVRFRLGSQSITSEQLTWTPGQWYFMEAAWQGNDYMEIWRDGIPIGILDGNTNVPTLNVDMYIGHRGDGRGEINGKIDELYILNTAHKYEIWGYNQYNPYTAGNPSTLFQWNMDSSASSQTPQKGSGTITLGGSYEAVTPAVANDGLEFSGNGQSDYAAIPTTDNILFGQGRVGFWYQPRNGNSIYSYNTPRLLNASGCSGVFRLTRNDDQQLTFEYGSISQQVTLQSQAYDWDSDWWYFIEAAYDAVNDSATLYINRQEVAVSTTAIEAPTGCTTLYVGNENNASSFNGEGNFDELYILDDPYPESDTQDILNTDYKRVKITVSWNSSFGPSQLYMLTDIAPPGIETAAGGGTLIFNIFDANGAPIQGATVDINNTTLDPPISLSLTSNADGKLIVPGAPATSTSYEILVTKAGYNSDYTSAPTSTYLTPVKDHLSVLEGQVTESSFAIDLTSNLTIQTVSQTLPVNWQLDQTNDAFAHTNPTLAHTDTFVYSAWEDTRSASTTETYANKYSLTGTSQWPADEVISTYADQSAPDISLDAADNQYIVWADTHTGTSDIFLAKYSLAGLSLFTSPKQINNTTTTEQLTPVITPVGNNFAVAWRDTRTDGGDIYVMLIDSNGTRLLGSDLKINTDTGNATQHSPQIITASDDTIYISWIDNRSGTDRGYVRALYNDTTARWPNEIQITSSATDNVASIHTTVDSADALYLVWNDTRNGTADIWWQAVASSSVLIYGQDQPVATAAINAEQQNPHISITDDDQLLIAWHDNRGGDFDIFVDRINPLTNLSVWPQEVLLNLETGGDQLLSDLTTYQGNRVLASWTDYSQSNPHAWAGTLNYDGSEQIVPYVTLDIQGAKLTHTSPDAPKYAATITSNAQGQIELTGLEWDTYSITITDADVSFVQADPTIPYLLSPGTSTSLKLIVD